MISVYLDESRHSEPNSFMVVAGFYGKQEQWEGIVPEWTAALGKRRRLHMSALRVTSKPDRAKKLLDKLGPLPYKHGLIPVHGAVRVADYLDLVPGRRRAQFSGYSICMSAIMAALSSSVAPNESIKIVCEMPFAYREEAERMFRGLRPVLAHPLKPYFSGIEFIPKESSVLTQPGDFLAYAIGHYFEDRGSLKSRICLPIFGPAREVQGYALSRELVRQVLSLTGRAMGPQW